MRKKTSAHDWNTSVNEKHSCSAAVSLLDGPLKVLIAITSWWAFFSSKEYLFHFSSALMCLNLPPSASVPVSWDPCVDGSRSAHLLLLFIVQEPSSSSVQHTPKVSAGGGMIAARPYTSRSAPGCCMGTQSYCSWMRNCLQSLGAGINDSKSPGTCMESIGFSYSAAFLGNHLPPDLIRTIILSLGHLQWMGRAEPLVLTAFLSNPSLPAVPCQLYEN